MLKHSLPTIVYSNHYNISLFGLDFLHPFDGCKYGKALGIIRGRVGSKALNENLRLVDSPISETELSEFHTEFYLSLMKEKVPVCRALELMPLRYLPMKVIDSKILEPMRYATKGTVEASEQALKNGLAINLGGGFHHATKGQGGGFCIYADVPVAIQLLRTRDIISRDSRIGIIDLDAHQGQGFAWSFKDDNQVIIFDAYNADVYPGDQVAKGFTDRTVELHSGCNDQTYLSTIEPQLYAFLDEYGPFDLVYYNAGTDIVSGDKLGAMDVSPQGVLNRDRMVLDTLAERGIPTVMLTSGGYTKMSHKLIADTIIDRFECGSCTSGHHSVKH